FVVSMGDPKSRWVMRPKEAARGGDGTDKELVLQFETPIEVSGKVLDSDGRPVVDIAIAALADSREGPGLDSKTTDADGRCRMRLPSGRAKIYFNGSLKGLHRREEATIEIQTGQGKVEGPVFTLKAME